MDLAGVSKTSRKSDKAPHGLEEILVILAVEGCEGCT